MAIVDEVTVTEKGYDHGEPAFVSGFLAASPSEFDTPEREYVPELMYPNSIGVYHKMRHEPKIHETMEAFMSPILGARRWIEPNGARSEVIERMTKMLNVPVVGHPNMASGRRRGRFDVDEHFRLALDFALTYGHMFFAQQWRIDGTFPNLETGLRKLGPRFPSSIGQIVTERDGGLKGIRQVPPNQLFSQIARGNPLGLEPLIGVKDLVAYSYRREGAAWQGKSILRQAYRPWRMKDEALRIMMISTRRNGMGQPVYEGAEGETEDQLKAGAELARKSRVSENGGIGVPHGATMRFRGVEGTIPDHLGQIRYFDEEMAGTMLAEFLKLGSSKSGSRALGYALIDFFVLQLAQTTKWLYNVFNQHVIEDWVDLNWGEDEPAPLLVSEPPGTNEKLTAEAVRQLVECGAWTLDDPLEDWLRERFDAPVRDESTARPRPTAAPAQPPVMPADNGGGDDG